VAKEKPPKQANILLDLSAEASLFRTADDMAYADIFVNGHCEIWPVRSKAFKQWLSHKFFARTKGAPSGQAMQDALGVIEAKARFDSPEREVHLRVAAAGDKIYLNLSDDRWRAVEISANGWRVVDNPPVHFRRTAGMLPLQPPVPGGSIEELRPFLNLKEESGFVLAVASALGMLRGKGPYPLLALAGEQGAGKSTFVAVLRSLVDPNSAPMRAFPRDDRDLFIAANNAHVLAFDNVSAIPAWISDTLCRLATGGGFATRQ